MRNRIPGRRRPWAPLLSALISLAGGKAELLRHVERPWASVTFSGTRHMVTLAFTGAEAVVAANCSSPRCPNTNSRFPGRSSPMR
jgi:hypothetical protein